MADFYNAVMTDGGAELLIKALQGTAKIAFTRLSGGNGTYTDEERTTEELKQRTALKSEIQNVGISRIDPVTNTSIKMTAVLTNEDLVTGYYLREVGIWAINTLDLNPTPILYAISIARVADYIPPYNGLTPTTSTQVFYTTVDNSQEVTLEVSSDAYALASDMQDCMDAIAGMQLSLGKTGQNVLALYIALELDEEMEISGGGGNIAIEDFTTDDDFTVNRGTYDGDNNRVYA
jgi:hypothetical protein